MTAKFPEAATATRSPYYSEHVTVTYRASANWYHPSDGGRWPGSSVESTFTCTHKHRKPEQAIACGQRGAAKAAASWQRWAEREYPKRPCKPGVFRDEGFAGREVLFLNYCGTHGTHGGTMHATEALAEAQGWECPWAPFVAAEARQSEVA